MGLLIVRKDRALRAAHRPLREPGHSIHIDRTFPLDQVPEALAHVGEGHALGKVVVELA